MLNASRLTLRRSPGPKAARRFAVARIRPAGDVGRIVRAASPACTALLAGGSSPDDPGHCRYRVRTLVTRPS